MSKNNGGTAFPFSVKNDGAVSVSGFHGDEIRPGTTSHYGGMSLRDYFAAKAVQGMLAAPQIQSSDESMLARDAYTVADAMLAERAKGESA